MKLSDMMETLTAYSKELEEKAREWQDQAADWAEDAQAKAKDWAEDADTRWKAANESMADYIKGANKTAQAEWAKAEDVWAEKVAEIRESTAKMQADIEGFTDDKRAEAAEAYAASMSKFALAVQNEAEKAMSFAAKERGEAEK